MLDKYAELLASLVVHGVMAAIYVLAMAPMMID